MTKKIEIVIQRYNVREKKWKDNSWIARGNGLDTEVKALEFIAKYEKDWRDEAVAMKSRGDDDKKIESYLKKHKPTFRAIQRETTIVDIVL